MHFNLYCVLDLMFSAKWSQCQWPNVKCILIIIIEKAIDMITPGDSKSCSPNFAFQSRTERLTCEKMDPKRVCHKVNVDQGR